MLGTNGKGPRWIAGMLALSMIAPLAGCMGGNDRSYAGGPAPNQSPAPAPRQGGGPFSNMSTGQKLAVIGGAAALYYLYKKHQNAQGAGPTGQYYRSRNGRVYYRDRNGNPVWVTPPSEGIRVPQDEVQMYEQGARDSGITYPGGPNRGGAMSGSYSGARGY